MFPTSIPFPSSDDSDKENIPVNHSEKRNRCNALINGSGQSASHDLTAYVELD